MYKKVLMVVAVLVGNGLLATADVDISARLEQELAQRTADLNDATQNKIQAETELENRQKYGASVEQISQAQLSLQALTKLANDAQQRLEVVKNKMHVLQVKPQS